jgi:tripartite-type tricarboxylate transporter receptor subunit TctC
MFRLLRALSLGCLIALLFAMTAGAPVLAQGYPSRTVTVIVPFPPGGSVDGVGRIIVDRLNQAMGPHFIVENRAGGASGNVGANVVAKADPDGYTLLETASLHVVSPFLYKDVRRDEGFHPDYVDCQGPADCQHGAECAGEQS